MAVPDTPPIVAVIVTGPPTVTPVASPWLLIVATAGLFVVHVTKEVKSFVEASLYVPVAVYCCVVVWAIIAADAVTAMDDKVAVFTVRLAVPDTPA